MRTKSIYKKLKSIDNIKVARNEKLFKHTTIKVGGKAPIFLLPKNEEALMRALFKLNSKKRSIFVIGNGSNTLISDKGIDGIAIKIGGGLSFININGSVVRVGAGVNLQKLIRLLAKKGLGGLEFAAGVPASVGGAVWMNMGAYGKQISSLIKEVKTVSFTGSQKIWKKNKIKFSYRSSIFQGKKLVITEVTLKMKKGKPRSIKKKIEKFLNIRKSKQPLSVPSFGSTFKNPKGYYAAELIEKSGLKGLRLGDAQVSTKHANFIINLGGASSGDIVKLIEKVRRTVKQKSGISLVPEIKMIEF